MMHKDILIVSNAKDLHALAVRRELTRLGCRVHLVASDELRSHPLCYEFCREPYLRVSGQRVNVSDISTVWWRRPSLNQNFAQSILDEDELDFVNRNCSSVLRSFLTASFSGNWVSSP